MSATALLLVSYNGLKGLIVIEASRTSYNAHGRVDRLTEPQAHAAEARSDPGFRAAPLFRHAVLAQTPNRYACGGRCL